MYLQGSQDSHQLDLDAETKYNLSSLSLMNNAATRIAETVIHRYPEKNQTLFSLAGPGNNGNDTVIASQLLHEAGYKVVLFQFLPDRVAETYAFLRENIPYDHFVLDNLNDFQHRLFEYNPSLLVDGLFGIGLSRPVPDLISSLFVWINSINPRPIVFSVDIPSGVSSDTGQIANNAIRANYTITFDTMKNGHLLFPGKEYSGKVIVTKIGFPEDLLELHSPGFTFLNDHEMKLSGRSVLPKRPDNSYKSHFGKAGMIGGSDQYPGALAISTESCLRIGTGLVYGIFLEQFSSYVNPILKNEVIRLPITEQSLENPGAISNLLHPFQAIGFGPGLGRKHDFSFFAKMLIIENQVPVVIDADGLYYCKHYLDYHSNPSLILTPHLGEMSALTDLPVETIQADLLKTAFTFSSRWNAIVVLKSATTVIAKPDGRYYIHPFSQSSLAKGGSGDLLTGMICGLLAQGTDPFWSAVFGVYLHAYAAMKASEKFSDRAVLPSDISNELTGFYQFWEKD